jgi:hypothetical protein
MTDLHVHHDRDLFERLQRATGARRQLLILKGRTLMPATYRFLITDTVPALVACSYEPSAANPGKTICMNEDGSALVVEPLSAGGKIRNTRPDESADTPWCWADACGDLLVYRVDPDNEPDRIVAFRMVQS